MGHVVFQTLPLSHLAWGFLFPSHFWCSFVYFSSVCVCVCACQFAIPVDVNAVCNIGTVLKDLAALLAAVVHTIGMQDSKEFQPSP